GYHYPQAHYDARRYRADHRHKLGPYFPRRTGIAAVVLPASVAEVVELPHSCAESVYVRQQHAPRRWYHWRAGPQCCPGHLGGSPMSAYDMILLNSSPDALIVAAYLARSGSRVLVLEPTAQLGGAVATAEFVDGFRADIGLLSGRIDPSIVD